MKPWRKPPVLLHKETTERVVNEVFRTYPHFPSLRLFFFVFFFEIGASAGSRNEM